MGSGGAAQAIQVIRANRNLLKKKRNIGNLSFVSAVDEKWVDPKKATFDQLLHIRRNIRDQNATRKRKVILVTMVILALLWICVAVIPWGLIFINVH